MNNNNSIIGNSEIRFQASAFWLELTRSKETENKEGFNEAMLAIIPEIRKYIIHRLNVQLKKGLISKGKHEVDEFIDELFIEAYDNLPRFNNPTEFSNWLYQKVDELLEDASIDDQFETLFFKNIDTYTQVEWDSMEEQYTIDGGGDLLMIEELNGQTDTNYFYTLRDVFIEGKDQELIEKIDRKLTSEKINNHFNLVLSNLTLNARNLFDLSATQKLEASDISKIKHLPINEVSKSLNDLREKLRDSFKVRYDVID